MIRVTVEDLKTGGVETQQFDNDYLLLTVGNTYLHHTQVYPTTGTTVLTIKTKQGGDDAGD